MIRFDVVYTLGKEGEMICNDIVRMEYNGREGRKGGREKDEEEWRMKERE